MVKDRIVVTEQFFRIVFREHNIRIRFKYHHGNGIVSVTAGTRVTVRINNGVHPGSGPVWEEKVCITDSNKRGYK